MDIMQIYSDKVALTIFVIQKLQILEKIADVFGDFCQMLYFSDRWCNFIQRNLQNVHGKTLDYAWSAEVMESTR